MTVVFVEAKNCSTVSLRMSQSVVMFQDPGVVVPHVWTFTPYVFPQSPQNVAIEFSVHHLSWWDKFLMHDAFNVKLLPHFRLFWSKVVKNPLHH